VVLFDFMGVEAITGRPLDRIVAAYFNRAWVRCDRTLLRGGENLALFVGEADDIPVHRLGPGLPTCRAHALEHYRFVGYVLGFDPAEYADRAALRRRLGYDERPLIVAAIGGTSVGADLLSLCGRALPSIRRSLPDAHLVLVCGPRADPASVGAPEGADVRGFVPDLHEHFAACDLAIVQGGGTSTLELTALRRPFLYFPLEGHFEQEVDVAGRLARHGAGIRLRFSETSPEGLACAVLEHIGATVGYPAIPIGGADTAAQLILSRVA